MIDPMRWKMTSDLSDYLECGKNQGDFANLREEVQTLRVSERMEEFMFLGLRMMKGVSSRRFLKLFNKNINDVYAEPLEENIKNNLLCKYRDDSGVWYCLTPHGIDISNTVMADFML